MRHRRSVNFTFNHVVTLLMAASIAACGSERQPTASSGESDPLSYDEAALTPLATPCTFNATTGLMTVTVAAGETAIMSKRAADSGILQNGVACDVLATSTTLKKIAITGSAGDDKVILDFTNGFFALGTSSAASSGISVDLLAGTDSLGIKGTTGNDTFTFGATSLLMNVDTNKDITPSNIESFVVSLGDGDDTYSGAGNATAGAAFGGTISLYGSAGNDTFNQGTASTVNETIFGGSGTDTVSYASRTAAVTVTLGAGANDGAGSENDDLNDDIEVVTGGSAGDTMTAATGVAVTFNGGLGADTLTGDTGADTINGGGGNDTITGGAGADTLNGDDGDDTFDEEATPNGGDTFNGGAGTDTVDYSARTGVLVVTMDGATANDGESGELDNVKADVENLMAGDQNDDITGNALNNEITGGDGDDDLTGGAGDDVFVMGSANDGDDTVVGGTGSDTVDYGARSADITAVLDGTTACGDLGDSEADILGADVENLWGGSGDDDFTGNASANELVGGAGDDTLTGGLGDDTLEGGGGSEDNDLDCGAGIDIAFGEGTSGSKTTCEL